MCIRDSISADANGMHILTAGSSEQKGVQCVTDGATSLYHSGLKKLSTNGTYGTVLSNTTDNASYTNTLLLTRRGYEASGYGVVVQA